MAEEFTRPNGKPYMPRKPPSVETFLDHNDDGGVVVLRTLDFQRAIELASDLIDEYELDPTRAYTAWWRAVPFDPSGYHDWAWIDDPARGLPCVVIPHG
jgi:hypothetical protein